MPDESDANVLELIAQFDNLKVEPTATPQAAGAAPRVSTPGPQPPRLPFKSASWIHDVLVKNQEPILFVGESDNRSLPIAIAAMRGSFNGIWASSFEGFWDLWPVSALEDSMKAMLERAKGRVEYNAEQRVDWIRDIERSRKLFETLSQLIDSLAEKSLADIGRRFSLRIDATNLPELNIPIPVTHESSPSPDPEPISLTRETLRNIWFQCPWSSSTETLISGFIRCASRRQIAGDAIFLGLTTHEKYRGEYPDIKELAHEAGYAVLPQQDRKFIQSAIDLGYVHQKPPGNWDKVYKIDKNLLPFHVTYIIVKSDNAKDATTTASDES
ncbi:hypothetical protein C8F01DRAFT_1286296 [Mycena amicta]|nr:hypothetical protein C8F01DRAFT_1286296 [Mycena amicta]